MPIKKKIKLAAQPYVPATSHRIQRPEFRYLDFEEILTDVPNGWDHFDSNFSKKCSISLVDIVFPSWQ